MYRCFKCGCVMVSQPYSLFDSEMILFVCSNKDCGHSMSKRLFDVVFKGYGKDGKFKRNDVGVEVSKGLFVKDLRKK